MEQIDNENLTELLHRKEEKLLRTYCQIMPLIKTKQKISFTTPLFKLFGGEKRVLDAKL